MPICCMCRQDKPAAAFAFRSLATGELQSHCRECHAAYRRQHYLDNKPVYIAREVARIKQFREQNRVLLFEYLSTHPCVDCGETDVLVLEFDHRDPSTKRGNIAHLLVRKSWKRVLAEIETCDVRCANCHRRRTAAQFRWAKASKVLVPPVETIIKLVATTQTTALELKTCIRCKRAKAIDDFYIRNRKTGRRSTVCRACSTEYGRRHYANNRPTYLERSRRNKEKNKTRYEDARVTRVLSLIGGRSCVDCGETDPVLLDFDHRDGETKIDAVATLVARRDWAAVELEISKCDVRCANCHRRRTAKQFGWTRLALQTQAAEA